MIRIGLFRKKDLFGFAEYFNRYANRGLTMEELLVNYLGHLKEPRDINKAVESIKNEMEAEVAVMNEVVDYISQLMDLEIYEIINGTKTRPNATARQIACYIGVTLGIDEADIADHFSWDRSSIYARNKKCRELAFSDKKYRNLLDEVSAKFGIEPISEYI